MSSTLSWGIAYVLAAVVLYLVTRAIPALKDLPYAIPQDGPTGKVTAAAGWSPSRPAHIHYDFALAPARAAAMA